ncbi:MAG: GNAT family N-acetyltransferase [Flavobacteriaceae bacterium]|nr:MAG: GNAT family N-acetyltransferase [Flavobacteriaceae bacterium]
MAILSTDRLVIEKVTLEDAPSLIKLMNDKDWIRNIGDRNIKTLEAAREHIKERFFKSYDESDFGFYAVRLKNDKTFIGVAGLIHREGLEHVDIGYGFLPEFRGKGYAFEAAKSIFEYGLNELKIEKILAIVNPANKASIHLLEKLGLRYEKMVRLPDEDKDIMLFS